ncbi:MAG: CDP-alcohol phosphatidyltransferase family protein [Desulfobacterales bacterium]|nr:CDP-alcohol phosphatidyltransferase family protein [Desulfobacterales bacterium]
MAFRRKPPYDGIPKKGVYLLPNTLTLCGMLSGFFAILSAINGNFLYAAWAIIIANIFDGLDGWIARLTNTTTRFGIELDSLSDLVAFGVAPSVMMYKWALQPFGRVGWAAAFLFVACGALRTGPIQCPDRRPVRRRSRGCRSPGLRRSSRRSSFFITNFTRASPIRTCFIRS